MKYKQLSLQKALNKFLFNRVFSFLILFLTVALTIVFIGNANGLLKQVEAATYTAGYQTWNGGFDNGNNNIISATQVTTGANGGISQSISIYIGSVTASPNNHIQVGIYTDNGSNNPGTLVGKSASQVLTPNSWNTVALPNLTINPNTKYFLAFNLDGSTTKFGWNSTTSGISRWKFNTTFGTWPTTFGTPSVSQTQQYAIYMNYASATPTVTPTITPIPTNTPTPPPGDSQTYKAGYQTWNGTFDSGNNNIISATQVTSGATGGISQSLSIYMGSVTASPNNHIQVGIYADNGSNRPGTLLGSSPSQVITPNSWNTIALPNITINPNTKYFLAFNLDGSTTQFGWNSQTVGVSRWKFNNTFGTWPTTFGRPSVSQTQQYAIYLTYVGGGSVTTTPTPTSVATPTPTPTPGGAGLSVQGVTLMRNNNTRFIAKGVNMEYYRDPGCSNITYNTTTNATQIIVKLKSLGINAVRLNYTASWLSQGANITTYLDMMQQLANNGIYVIPSDHTFTGQTLTDYQTTSFPLFQSIIQGARSRGIENYLIMNPYNEPYGQDASQSTWANWIAANETTLQYLRSTLGFNGVVVLDTKDWAADFDKPSLQAVMQYDASLRGGQSNVIFSNHWYPNISYQQTVQPTLSQANTIPLVIGEVGSTNGSVTDENYVITLLGDEVSTYIPSGHNGVFPWIWSWCSSSMTQSDQVTLTPYGQLFVNYYYSKVN